MSRALWILTFLLAACGSAPKILALPDAVPGGWKRQSLAEISLADAPGRIPSLGMQKAFRATYDGPTSVEVEVYQFPNTSAAFEARQTWQPDPARMARHAGVHFLVARSPQPDRSALETFLLALEKTL